MLCLKCNWTLDLTMLFLDRNWLRKHGNIFSDTLKRFCRFHPWENSAFSLLIKCFLANFKANSLLDFICIWNLLFMKIQRSNYLKHFGLKSLLITSIWIPLLMYNFQLILDKNIVVIFCVRMPHEISLSADTQGMPSGIL